jgi:uncharacterized protein (TIGR03083 family)
MTDIWPVIHTERQALADDLQNVDDQQWQTPSMCAGWTVHDVLAHMLATAKMTPPQFFLGFAGTGFNFNKFADKNIKREGAGGPNATLNAFRAAQNSTNAPPGPKDTWLGETFVHSEDIRRPLSIKHDYPLPFVTRVITLYARSNALIGGKSRVAGLTLRATDNDFTMGSGPLVEGPAVALMLATAGRKNALSDLTGDGVQTLTERTGGVTR